MSQTIQDLYGRDLTIQERQDIVKAAGGSAAYPSLYANGQEINAVDLKQWTEDALQSVGRDITTFVSQSWATSEHGSVGTDLAKVSLVGGGAYAFHAIIARLLPHITVPPQPELANALGYAELARYMQSR